MFMVALPHSVVVCFGHETTEQFMYNNWSLYYTGHVCTNIYNTAFMIYGIIMDLWEWMFDFHKLWGPCHDQSHREINKLT